MWLVLSLGCATRDAPVRPGIDVLVADSIHLVAGRRVGLLTNQSGRGADGVDDVTLLLAAGVDLRAIFSPEHGFRGVLDQENIGHHTDSATGLPVYSLYGAERQPTAEQLATIDVLLVDLQDIGARTYTYVSSALTAYRAATDHDVAVIVLDRPNPIGGETIQGPMLDTAFASWVGMVPVPLRHGMTIGELLRWGVATGGTRGNLTVIPVAGWKRSMWYDDTGLPWVRPSPNIPDLESATHYSGLVMFERTNLSVGRGTPLAFQVIAAPWLDARALADDLSGVAGVTARDTVIRPAASTDHKYDGMTVAAVRLAVTDRAAYDPVRLAVAVLAFVQAHHGDSLVFQARGFDERAGSDRVRLAVAAGVAAERIAAEWADALTRFRRSRTPFLLY